MSAAHRSRKRLLVALGAAGTGLVAAYLAYRHYASNAATAEEEAATAAGELKEEAEAKAAQEHDEKNAALAAQEFGVAPENATARATTESADVTAAVTAEAEKVQKLINAMSPHRLEEPLQESLNLDEMVAFFKHELEVAEQGGSSDVLMQAADAVVADLVLIPFPTVQASNTKLNALICAGLHRRGGSGVVEDGLVPLKTQLQCVQDVLQ
eukprot:gene16718-3877_t